MVDATEVFQQLLPKLSLLETERKKILYRTENLNFVTISLVLVAAGLLFILFKDKPDFKINQLIPHGVVLLIILIIIIGYQFGIKRRFRTKFKSEVITEIVAAIAPEMTYDPKGKIDKDKFSNSRLFNHSIERYQGEDYIAGKLDKTVFELSEVHAKEEREYHDKDGKSRTRYSTIFKGLFMVADFHKHFQGQTYVLPDNEEKQLGSWISKKVQQLNFVRGTLIQMEDPDFEKEFKVYTSDVVEARYLLSPKLMRDILDLQSKFSCRLYISFLHSNIYLALATEHNFMELDFQKNLLEQTTIQSLLANIVACINIVEDLNLNTRIWSKQTY